PRFCPHPRLGIGEFLYFFLEKYFDPDYPYGEARDQYCGSNWYNHKRIKLSLGGMSPIEYRHHLGFAA
ncbi:MAG: IS3 family transposase, partial [Evtepia sp.]|nr:IS3 family transposase [Evtepia sp.]